MSHKITIEISDGDYARLLELVRRWARENDNTVKIEAEACFMTGLKAQERKSA